MSRTVVLVHGAWHGAWCWEQVLPLLDAAAVPVVAVDLPSVSYADATLHDDADYVRGALDSIDGEVVLVGHSYGGAVISEAGRAPERRAPRVPHRVRARRRGVAAGEHADRRRRAAASSSPRSSSATGVFTIDPEPRDGRVLPRLHARGCARGRGAAAAAVDGVARRTRSRVAAWREKPATYVVCTDDRALPVALQRSNAARIGELDRLADESLAVPEPARPRRRPADRSQLALTIAATSASDVTHV